MMPKWIVEVEILYLVSTKLLAGWLLGINERAGMMELEFA